MKTTTTLLVLNVPHVNTNPTKKESSNEPLWWVAVVPLKLLFPGRTERVKTNNHSISALIYLPKPLHMAYAV